MGTEIDSPCGGGYGEVSPERVNRRNGYRQRRWDSRVGMMNFSIPKVRKGRSFSEWIPGRRRRSERSLVQVVAECYIRVVTQLEERVADAAVMRSEAGEEILAFTGFPKEPRRPDPAPRAEAGIAAPLAVACLSHRQEQGRSVKAAQHRRHALTGRGRTLE